MKDSIKSAFCKFGLILFLSMFSIAGRAQQGQYTMSISSATATINTIDVSLSITVTNPAPGMRFGGFQTGINYNTAIVNGGTITASYVGGKSTELSGLNTAAVNTATAGQIRLPNQTLTGSNGVDMAQGTTFSLGTYRITNSVSWATGNANLWLQNILAAGKTNSVVTGYPYGATTPAASYSTTITTTLNGDTVPTLILGYTQAAPYSLLAGPICATSGSAVVTNPSCFGETGSAVISLSPTPFPAISSVSYTVDSGTAQTASITSGNSFSVSGLSNGTHTIVVSVPGCSTVTVSPTVNVPTQLVASSSAGTISCNGATTTVTVSAAGGTAPYTGAGTFTVSAGAYSYTVTDANGCSSTTTGTVSQPTQLVASSSTGTISCNGGTTTVTVSATGGTAPYTGAGTFTVSAGAYSYIVTDANGCSSTTTGTVSQPDQLVASSNAGTISCNGGTTTVTVSATGGTAPYTGAGTFTVSAGAYSYTVTDANGCSSTTTGTVSQPDQLVASSSAGTISCNGATTTVTVSATGGTAPYTGAGTFTVSAGAYSYTIIDANGCSSTTTGTVLAAPSALVASSSAGTISCNGGTTTVTVSATGGTAPYTGAGTFTVSAGAYSYTVTDANGCSSTTTGTVSQPDQLTNSTTASACGSYTWLVNGQTYTTSGTFTGTTTPGSGCAVYETLNLTITPNTTGTTTVSACDTYTWSAGNGNTYTSTPSTAPTFVSGCNTQTLALTITPSTTGTTTASACDTYTWSAGNGNTYTSTPTTAPTFVSGCNTQTLALTITPSTTGTTTASACDTYTWSAGNGNTYTSTPTTAPTFVSGCNTQTLALTIKQSTTSSETQSACGSYLWSVSGETYSTSGTKTFTSTNAAGCPDTKVLILTIIPVVTNTTTVTGCDSYTWPLNSQTYTASGSFSVTTGCNTEFLELTINTSSVYYADTDGDGYGNASSSINACSQPTGYVTDNTDCDDTIATVYPGATEVFNGIDDNCNGTIDEGTTPPAPGVTDLTVCAYSPFVTLTATALPGYTLSWYTVATEGTALPAAPVVDTTYGLIQYYWVSQRSGTGPESPRALITVTVFNLPGTPGEITGTTAICVSVGTTNVLTYSVVPVTGATSYQWTVPTGATIVSGHGTNTISVNFENISAGVTPQLTIVVRGVNSTTGCLSLPKTLYLKRVLPTAPTALVMTNGVTTTPILAVGPFIGTTTTLTLTATASATATSYIWTLPTGVNQLSGGNSNVITVNFAGVGTGIGALPISVQSINGCGISALRTLSLTRAIPAKPVAITPSVSSICTFVGTNAVITYTIASVSGAFANGYAWTVPTGGTIVSGQGTTQIGVTYDSSFVAGNVSVTASNGVGTSAAKTLAVAKVSPTAPAALVMTDGVATTPIVAVGPFIGTTTVFTLTATASATATSYTWTLPAGVNQLSGGNSNVITVNFAGIGTGVGTLPINVQSTNGCGSSTLRTLSLTRALPAKPGTITASQTNICAIAGTSTQVTYSVAAVGGAFVDGYIWTIPTGATIVSGASLMQGSTTSYKGFSSITVTYSSSFNTAGSVTVFSSNGVGLSSSAATFAVAARAGVVAPAALVGPVTGLCAGTAYNYSFAAVVNAQTYTITGPEGSIVTSADNASNTTNTITTSNTAFTVVYPTTAIANISIVASNPCGSVAKAFTVSKAPALLAPTIIGLTIVDTCSTYTYNASAVGAVGYIWTVPANAVITSGQGTSTLAVTFPGTLPAGAAVTVAATNACGLPGAIKSVTLRRTTCSTAREQVVLEEVTKAPFSVKAYPNPYTETFNLSLTTTSEDKVSVVVYDMTGRLIERRDVRPSDMIEQQIGDRYPSGVYNVVITQGEEVKTLRVIKR